MILRKSRSLLSVLCHRPCAAVHSTVTSCPKSTNNTSKMRRSGGAHLTHALIVIFLEYFAWGLLTVPVINVLAETFPTNKFLMNGLILGLKGLLSFLSAPLVGSLSDIWGRKNFLFITVFFTCMPIPCLKISAWWYFTLFTLSGFFSVTFSVALAYVADITEKHNRARACGYVSATFAASLITSPALGAYISSTYNDELAVWIATSVFALDLLFIALCVPESLPEIVNRKQKEAQKLPPSPLTLNESFNWQSIDPFMSLRIIAKDSTVLQLSAVVFLSFLPESGQFSCFFVYLKLMLGFSPEAVAAYIAFVGGFSVLAQTGVLPVLTKRWGVKHSISFGLIAQFIQLTWYGVGTQFWMMWAAGLFSALSSLTYPAISAFVSIQTSQDMQGTVQGVMTGIRGLCQGFGPAVFGFIFYMFDMDLSADGDEPTGHIGVGPQFPMPHIRLQPFDNKIIAPIKNETIVEQRMDQIHNLIPGPPFLFGALLVFMALMVNINMPSAKKHPSLRRATSGSAHMDTALLMGDDKEDKD
ncbi:unnamed protein product [Bursaphelenchus okinawaensis]|uniref:MFS domain-containing protein n=1 Tax=Bursaphelenchus okinawaensis TaxID=465554 RepID=A0A811KA68_9BILA|nr:unnamed protein product [Bursaphelenchus okinawaensis]CAG9098543.1 unnamed protein product [Bursaphelenchus okinawaensis]